ncbi:multicopper oxidase family protein [Zooshikella harenae]|uniref:Multicopper oxidase domain-containing protein n=1 Tax=Zooshikella harenae TaxID=2827238 RepID=A0ABS5Z910_9GAMM|nr:multicopper oxidase domain-containing protein [Zooshikella harenae]MBU2709785.1 multicopper oxidase domain-containing protein [Zooshikella harenae]
MDRRQFLTVASGVGALGVLYSGLKTDDIKYEVELTESDNLLYIPPILNDPFSDFYSLPTLTINNKTHSFFHNIVSSSIGLSSSKHQLDYLGPTIKVKRGDVVKLSIKNQTNEVTMNHWHGLHIPGSVDGSPHQLINPGESWNTTLHIQQEAATCWYHPLCYELGVQQMYLGYAGLMIVEDENNKSLNMPVTYGLDDIPLIVQDKNFDSEGKEIFNLNTRYRGNTLVINGTVKPYISVSPGWVRFRIVNATQSRILDFSFTNDSIFYQIATDGGMLNAPIAMQKARVAPGQRCELMLLIEEKQQNIAINIADTFWNDLSVLALKVLVEDVACTETVLPNKLRHNSLNVNFNLVDTLPIVKKISTDEVETAKKNILEKTIFNMNEIESAVVRDKDEVWVVQVKGNYTFHISGASFLVVSINGIPPENCGWQDTITIGGRGNELHQMKILISFNTTTYRHGVNQFQAAYNPTNLKYHVPYLYHLVSIDEQGVSKIGQFSVIEQT